MSEVVGQGGGERRPIEFIIPIRALLLVVAVVLGVWALFSIADALLLVFTGVFLAFVFEYPLRLLMARTGLGRGLAATILVLGTVLVVAVLALLLTASLLGNIRDLLDDSPQLVADLRDKVGSLGDTAAAGEIEDGAERLSDSVPEELSALVGIAGSAFTFVLAVFTIVFVALFVLVDMPKIKLAVASLLAPSQRDLTLDVWERITTTISRWAIGAGAIAIIAGTVQGTTAFLLGSSYALALGVIAGFLDLIPNLGATIAGVILVPVLYAEEGATAAVIMLVVVLLYQQVENNLLTPTIQRKATNIWASLVIISVTVFGALLGVLGALIAVPLTGSIQIVVQELTAARRERIAAMPPPAAVEAPAEVAAHAPAGEPEPSA